MTGDVRIALELAAAVQRLRHGVALNGAHRARLADLLWKIAVAELGGRKGALRPDVDPAALVEIAIITAREAGMSAPDIVQTVNAALECSAHPVGHESTGGQRG